MTNGKFIVFEGIEGSGKSTQAKSIDGIWEGPNLLFNTWYTSEPSNSPIGKVLREYLSNEFVDEKTAALLFAADRSLHIKEIEKHLNNGEWVICDRYVGSSLAYQNFRDPSNLSLLINKDFLRPDITFFVDISVDKAIERIQERNGIKEYFDNRSSLERIQKTYYDLIDYNEKSTSPCNIKIINGDQNISKIKAEIRGILHNLI